MLRLKNNNQRFHFIIDGEKFQVREGNSESDKGLPKDMTDIIEVIDPIQEYLDKQPVQNSYLDFIKIIREETAKKIPSTFLIAYQRNKIHIFKSAMHKDILKFVLTYKPENKELLEFTKKLFRLTDKKNYTTISSTCDNHFSFIVPWQVLEVLYAKADIEASGEQLYNCFQIPKKSGGMRDIVAPHEKIKAALRDLNAMLQRVYDRRNDKFQVAYKKGKSVKDGAKIHTDKKYVFNIDLSDFYPSCKKEIVKKYTDFLFSYAFNRAFIEEEFFKVIFINDGLFIGSPISGTLANAVISNAVSYMNNICKKYDIGLSVYADDITFSSDKFIVKEFIIKLFNEAFSKYGLSQYYTINEKKCVGFSGCNRKVTGVTINDSNKITVSNKYYRDLRVKIHHLSIGDTNNIDVRELRGKIAYATMLDESGKIYKYLDKYRSTVKQFNLCSDEKMNEMKEKLGL